MNTNYVKQMVTNLENKGCSKDYIIGFLSSTLQGVKCQTDSTRYEVFLQSMLKYTTMIDNSKQSLWATLPNQYRFLSSVSL